MPKTRPLTLTISDLSQPAVDPKFWPIDRDTVYLNHGSFGSCPLRVLQYRHEIQMRMERQPMQFFVRDLEPLLDEAREKLARFVGAQMVDLAFVPNATAGVNTVLRSLSWKRGDELLVTNQEYNACRNALDFIATRHHAKVVVASIPYPVRGPSQIIEAALERVTQRTRLVLIDHITSQTGMVLPLAHLIKEFAERGIDTLVDGAHAPGMIPLQLRRLNPTYYTGNCHKWLCAPKGAGFLYVQRERQKHIRPLSISHGANSPRQDRSRFLIEFDWTGTWDPSAYLSVPEAIRYMETLIPGGWREIMRRNHALALAAKRLICKTLRIPLPCPDKLNGALVSFPIPDARESTPPTSPLYSDPLQEQLRTQHGIEVPVVPWPAPPKRLLRISAQLYNSLPQYEMLTKALKSSLGVHLDSPTQ